MSPLAWAALYVAASFAVCWPLALFRQRGKRLAPLAQPNLDWADGEEGLEDNDWVDGMWLYVDCPEDGTTRRCWATFHPVWGFPVTPPLGDPAWEVVES